VVVALSISIGMDIATARVTSSSWENRGIMRGYELLQQLLRKLRFALFLHYRPATDPKDSWRYAFFATSFLVKAA